MLVEIGQAQSLDEVFKILVHERAACSETVDLLCVATELILANFGSVGINTPQPQHIEASFLKGEVQP